MNKILVFGNPLLKEDNLAFEIAKDIKIKNTKFIFCERAEELMDHLNEKIIILDVAKGIKDVKVLTDLDKIQESKINSLHDFDIGYFLKLMKAMDKINKVKIIALPISGDKEDIKAKVKDILQAR